MLARYTMYRGKRPDRDPLPLGIRQDTRKHTNHCLRPPAEIVAAYLANPRPQQWVQFKEEYCSSLEDRFRQDRRPFDQLAQLAMAADVFLGCSCPTKRNPDVRHCHTVVALEFMKRHYPSLTVRLP